MNLLTYVTLLMVSAGLCYAKDYFIAAEEREWNYAPEKFSESTKEGQRSAKFYLLKDRHRIGSRYKKAVFVEYTDDTFMMERSKPKWLGYLGPVLQASEGETLVIHFRNRASHSYSMHPHGVLYDKESEGMPYKDDKAMASDFVPPGGNHTYEWNVTARDSPAAGDPECLVWLYTSHVDPIRDINSGLIGPLVTCKKGGKDRRQYFRHEFILHFNVVDENKSWYLQENVNRYCWDSQGVDISDADFIESNKMHSINGYSFGNVPDLDVCVNSKVQWHLIGGGVDIHTVNFHGQSLVHNHHRVSSVSLYPSQFSTVTMKAQNKGRWLVKCQVHNHFSAGMKAFLNVNHCRRREMPYSLTGKIRRYYIAAIETIWDYAPSGIDVFNNQNLTQNNSHSQFFFQRGPGRIGGKYKKVVFRGYTDSTFRRQQHRSRSQRHLGLLGPVIRGEEGDLIKVVFRNRASRPYSIHPQGVNYNKFNEGARYDDDTRDVAKADDEVLPGKTKTYYWTMSRSMAPKEGDADCLTHMYTSGVDTVRDTYSGLIGPMLVCKRGTLDEGKKSYQKKMDREYFLLFTVIDENLSWYLKDTMDQFIQEPNKVDTQDKMFKKSNMMYSINGFVYGNLNDLDMCPGDLVSWHVMALGSEVDIHSIYFHGHTVLEGENRRSTVTVQPGSHHTLLMEADAEGDWAIVCRTNEHYNAGMVALFHSHQCEDGYRHKKDLNSEDGTANPPNVIPVRMEQKYYIAAEEVTWNYVPSGKDGVKGGSIVDPKHRGYNFLRHTDGYLGTTYKKVVYREYHDDQFQYPKKRLVMAGGTEPIYGPVIKAEVGDVIHVYFKNKAFRPFSIHGQGVAYNKSSEGCAYMNASWQDSGVVAAGGNYTYVWTVTPASGPGSKDPNCITHMYYSAVDPVRDTNSGLVGPVIICRKGTLTGSGQRTDISPRPLEFALLFAIFDENLSWYLDENIATYGTNVNKASEEFIQSNKIPGVNGLSLGNLLLEMKTTDNVEWYLMAVGAESDLHSIHFHGHTFIRSKYKKHRRDTIGLFPGTTATVSMKTDNPGIWLLHCHVNNEPMIGMEMKYEVYDTNNLLGDVIN